MNLIWKAVRRNEKWNIRNSVDGLNNLFDTAKRKINEMEDRAEDRMQNVTQRMQSVTQNDKNTENMEFRKLGNEVQTEQMYLDLSDFQKTILRWTEQKH